MLQTSPQKTESLWNTWLFRSMFTSFMVFFSHVFCCLHTASTLWLLRTGIGIFCIHFFGLSQSHCFIIMDKVYCGGRGGEYTRVLYAMIIFLCPLFGVVELAYSKGWWKKTKQSHPHSCSANLYSVFSWDRVKIHHKFWSTWCQFVDLQQTATLKDEFGKIQPFVLVLCVRWRRVQHKQRQWQRLSSETVLTCARIHTWQASCKICWCSCNMPCWILN